MRILPAFITTALLAPAFAWAQQPVEPAVPESAVDRLFESILDEAQQIDMLLSAITDKESAERSVALLEHMLDHMNTQLRTLEQRPFHSGSEAEALKTHMATLTHISQSYLYTMQRLAEVNAYGSDALIALFTRYKIDAEALPQLKAEDMPHTQLYNELADTLEDIIYTLNYIEAAEHAAAALPKLRALLDETDRTHRMLAQLVPPATAEQKEAVRPAREKLQTLSAELKKAIDRLQAAQCYGCRELASLLPKLLQTSAG